MAADAPARADFLITDSVVLLSDFTLSASPLATGSGFRVFTGKRVSTGAVYPVKVVDVATSQGSRLSNDECLRNFIYFLRPVATLLMVRHPALDAIVGWGITLGPSPQFAIITASMPTSQLQLRPDEGYPLNPTSRQIVLYGVARGLKKLHAGHLSHQDVQPDNILLDGNFYPRLQKIGEPSYTKNPATGEVTGGCHRYMAPEVFKPTGRPGFGSDSYSLGILFYEFLTDAPATFELQPGESHAAAIARGVRPAMTDETAAFQDVLTRLWGGGLASKRMTLAELVAYFEEGAAHWIPRTSADLFWGYKEYLDRAEAQLDAKPLPPVVVPRLFNRAAAAGAVGDPGELVQTIAAILGWLNSPVEGAIDRETRELVVSSLTDKALLHPAVMAKLHPTVIVPSFFTTHVADIPAIKFGSELGRGSFGVVSEATIGDDPVVYAVKVIQPAATGPSLPRDVGQFFREIFTQLYAAHPAVLRLVSWNIQPRAERPEDPPKFWAVLDKMKGDARPRGGRGPRSPTDKMIIVYGVARGMAFLHGLKILHRDLKPENVFLEENGYPRIADLGFAKYSDSKQQTVQTGTPLYLAPEVWSGLYYGFPADVYSYAMLFYEVIEGKAPMLKNVKTHAQQKAAVCDRGLRPMVTHNTTPRQQELLTLMWAPGADSRPTFEEIASCLEDEAYWCPKTDRDLFLKYKAYLDHAEAESTESIISPVWVRQATRFVSIIKELAALKDPTVMIVRLLAYLTTESDESGVNEEAKAAVTQRLQTSFAEHNRIDAALFTDFARQFIAGTSQKRQRVWESNPLMDAVVSLADLEIEAASIAKVSLGDVFRGKRRANGSLVAVRRLNPTTGRQICLIYREIVTLLYCRHPCVLPLVGWNLVGRKQVLVVSEWMQNLSVNVQAGYSPTQKTIIMYGTARALLWLHNRGIVHGDVCPRNIFLDGNFRPRLGDLGAARGTASFADDILALAITFWEIIAGAPSGVDQAAREQGTRPSRRHLAGGGTLRSLLTSMWDRDPAARPKIADIVERLALPKLWVTGTEELPFQQYKTFVDHQQADVLRSKKADDDAWQAALEIATGVDALSQKLEADADVAAKAVHAIAVLFGKGGEENTKLREDLTAALQDGDSFVKPPDKAIDGLDPRFGKGEEEDEGE